MGALRGTSAFSYRPWNTQMGRRKFPSAQRARRSARSEPGVGARLGAEAGRQAAEVLSDDLDVIVLDGRGEALHDGVLAPALAVLLDRTHQVVPVLPGERGIHRRNGDPVLAVARDAERRGLRHTPARLARGRERLAREISRD